MKSFSIVGRQAGFVGVVAALLLALVVPILASAAEVTERSIELTSSSAGAEGVGYTVVFTPRTAGAGAVVIDFCEESPAMGAACTGPTGFTVASATVAAGTGSFAKGAGAANDANTIIVTGTFTEDAVTTVTLSGVTNPDAAGTMYARIATYVDATAAGGYISTETNVQDTDRIDTGAVAVAITDTIGVSGVVNESLVFCVSSKDITANCTLEPDSLPTLELGEGTGATKALSAAAISTGNIYTQISTNAASGAVVNLKSSAEGCGGLINSSAPTECYIQPAQQLGLAAGTAMFGVTVAAGTAIDGAMGTFQAYATNGYNNTTYALNYDEDDELTGVTSVFGDQILNTDGAPVSNRNAVLTFGASVAPNTPAGKYSADFSLIATGKF